MNCYYDIIIPTVESREKLTRCLQSIELLNNVNIILVDDGSNWDISTIQNDFELKLIKNKKNLGPSASRNAGAKFAKGNILIFMDADSILESDIRLLISEYEKLNRQGCQVMAGKINPGNSFWEKVLAYSEHAVRLHGSEIEYRDYLGIIGFLAIDKKLFFDIGCFKENMRVGEDRDLTYKLFLSGNKLAYNPKVVSFHNVKPIGLFSMLNKAYNYGLKLGLQIELKYSEHRELNWIKYIANIFIYPLFIFPLSFFITFRITYHNLKHDKKLIFYFPFIFFNRLSNRIGTWIWMIKN